VTEHNYAVLAVPPTVWSSITMGSTRIPVPPIQTGPAVKYLAETRGRYWVQQGDAPSGVDDDLGMLWEGTDNQMGSRGIDLTVFAGGPLATAIGTTAPDKYFDPRIDKLLPGFRGPRGVVKGQLVNWPGANFIRTGYSCPAPKQVMTLLLWMQQGIGGRVFFAGEHVSPPFFGYMEGALQSGVAAAGRIADAERLSLPTAIGSLSSAGVRLRLPANAPTP
jgi:monoamine oxidase